MNGQSNNLDRFKVTINAIYLILSILLAYVATNLDNNTLGAGFGIISGMYAAYATEPFWNYRKGGK